MAGDIDFENVSAQHSTGPGTSADTEAAADAEQDSVREAVEQSTGTAAQDSSAMEEDSVSTHVALVHDMVTEAAPDAEQAATQEAVERSLQSGSNVV